MNIRKTAGFVIFLVSINLLVIGQGQNETDYVSGELLVQLDNNSSIEKLLEKYQSIDLSNAELVSERFNIYLLKFNPSRTTNQFALHSIHTEKFVVNAQYNHYVSIREAEEVTPDDALFGDQWALENTGQDNGIPDADIDATEAWDLATGGVTALGDTIVVAIIDGGADINHEDLDFWKNKDEIPGNGIDDDNNGYIDDYDGWNAYAHNGTIPLYNHGTHVSGIAGAIGNNSIGVSGVNWNVKTLPIAGSSTTESVVVEALSYVYVVRERYDQTGGLEGAFIVANNCSFGVDMGQPENYPIWEAMYDSLGKIGVLSIAATANRNWDIDEVGDVPTAFTTDYMISVTNTDQTDEKFSGAAYGDTTIDLGAPGLHIMSLRNNNTYGYSSGTSMATPHVTGVVALLFSYADSAFITNYKNQPENYILDIKDFILNGVDSLDDLVGKTVTGGRLNAFNALKLLDEPPGPQPELTTNKDTIYVEVPMNSTLEDTLIIANTGSDTLFYTIKTLNTPDWLTLSDTGGMLPVGEQDSTFLLFDSNGLGMGLYKAMLNITGLEIPPKVIPVKMLVYSTTDVPEENVDSHTFVVFPNPFSNELNIHSDGFGDNYTTFELYDQTGRKVYSESFMPGKTANKIKTDVVKKSGIYYYQLMSDNKRIKSGKLVRR